MRVRGPVYCGRFCLPHLAAVLGTVCVLVFGCRHSAPSPPAPLSPAVTLPVNAVDVRNVNRTLTEQEAAAYVGDGGCRPCHAAICDRQNATRHAKTLRPVTANELGAEFGRSPDVTDPLLGVKYTTAAENGKCLFRGKVEGQTKSMSADYVLGSGKNALTFMSRVTDEMWIDLRLSYYTRKKQWDFTPMQKPGDREFPWKAGVEQSGARLVDCLHCHATVMRQSGRGIDASLSDLGVRCERCHGPGRAHAESARLAAPVGNRARITPLEDLGRAPRERINDVCGVCHRTVANTPPGNPVTENGLARFEGVALVRSACYLKSKELSCVTCHDPHGDADPSPARNDALCKSCHGGARGHVPHGGDRAGKMCPVNNDSGCVGCHMPAQTIPTIPHAAYHNHWIKVWKSGRGVAAQ